MNKQVVTAREQAKDPVLVEGAGQEGRVVKQVDKRSVILVPDTVKQVQAQVKEDG